MLLTAERIVVNGQARRNFGIEIDAQGRIQALGTLPPNTVADCVLSRKVLLPGLVSAHGQVRGRLWRGRRVNSSYAQRTFMPLEAHQLYVLARQVFLEMALSGVTCVGEFFPLLPGTAPEAAPLQGLADALLVAAQEVGIRLSLIHAVTLRQVAAGAQLCSLDAACEAFDRSVEQMLRYNDARLSWALGAYSLSHLPLDALLGLKLRLAHMPLQILIDTEPAALQACQQAHGVLPIELLARREILDAGTTLVFGMAGAATTLPADSAAASLSAAVLAPASLQRLVASGALVCVCPNSQAPAAGLAAIWQAWRAAKLDVAVGCGNLLQTSPLAAIRQLQAVSDGPHDTSNHAPSDAAAMLKLATQHSALTLGVDTGALQVGKWADFVSFDLDDMALLGADIAANDPPRSSPPYCRAATVVPYAMCWSVAISLCKTAITWLAVAPATTSKPC